MRPTGHRPARGRCRCKHHVHSLEHIHGQQFKGSDKRSAPTSSGQIMFSGSLETSHQEISPRNKTAPSTTAE